MPFKFRNRTETNSNIVSANKKKRSNITSQLPHTSSSEFQNLGLKGSNVQINFRIASSRTSAEALSTGIKPQLTISGCKSEDCLHASIHREKLASTRKILTDRPSTAVVNSK